MSEAANATAATTAAIGLPSLMWALDHTLWKPPAWAITLTILVSAALILISVVLWAHLLLKRLGLVEGSWWGGFFRVPFDKAAQRIYEAAEKADVLELMMSPTLKAQDKLNHFKMLLIVDDRVRLFGARPPSTKSRLISKAELHNELYPSERAQNALDHVIPADHPPAFVNVSIPRMDLRRIIKVYLTEYVDETKQIRSGRRPR
jgi:hypothetical protein